MKNLLRLEELAQFLLCLFLLINNDVVWWVYFLLVIGPDISMLGYLINTLVGSVTYNLFHHKALAVVLICFGSIAMIGPAIASLLNGIEPVVDPIYVLGLILYGHASLDRIFGYGLKFGDSFQHTHLGWIGKGLHEQEAGEGGRSR
jgi:hypothetical protein